MKIERICFIASTYPTKEHPAYTFLDQLVCQFADMGIQCTVIAPHSPLKDRLKNDNYYPAEHWIRTTKGGANIDVYCPKMPFALGRNVFHINFFKIYRRLFLNAVKKAYNKYKINADVIYAHFIVPSGLVAADLAAEYHKPYFIAYGESSFDSVRNSVPLEFVQQKLAAISGAIAVSKKNQDELIANHVVTRENVSVFPNAIDVEVFHRMDKKIIRKELGISDSCFIVAFVGHFIHRKGPLRLAAAIKGLKGINSFFIGAGEEQPDCDGILFSGKLPHEKIARYLNAADVFVLPTLAEGCCNAIVEAMACGLPVISSNLPFNDDILDETNSIRIDPSSVDEIRSAIQLLYENRGFREKLAAGALERASMLRIETRAENILKYMEEKTD